MNSNRKIKIIDSMYSFRGYSLSRLFIVRQKTKDAQISFINSNFPSYKFDQYIETSTIQLIKIMIYRGVGNINNYNSLWLLVYKKLRIIQSY